MKQCRLLLGLLILISISNVSIAQEATAAKPKTRIEILQEEIQKSPNNPELYLQLGIQNLENLRSVSNFIEKFRMQGMTITIDAKDDTVKNLLKSKELYVLQKLEVPFLLYRSLGEAYYHYFKFQEAKIEFQNALKKIPNEFETSNLLKICEIQIERVKFPQSDTLNYKLVEALFNANSIDFAKTKLAVLLEKFPENTTYKKMQEKIALAEKANELLGEGNDFSNKSDYKNALEKCTESLAMYKELETDGDKRLITVILETNFRIWATIKTQLPPMKKRWQSQSKLEKNNSKQITLEIWVVFTIAWEIIQRLLRFMKNLGI